MFEPELIIKCLPRDMPIVEEVLDAAEETFNAVMEEQTGRNYPIKFSINRIDTLTLREMGTLDEEYTKKREEA
jgi:hypothetical protein